MGRNNKNSKELNSIMRLFPQPVFARRIPRSDINTSLINYKRKAGYLASVLFRSSRPSTALVENRQSDTHAVGICSMPLKGVLDGMDSRRQHTNGNGIYLPVASTSAMFSTTNSICGSFELPKTKRQRRNSKCSAPFLRLNQPIVRGQGASSPMQR